MAVYSHRDSKKAGERALVIHGDLHLCFGDGYVTGVDLAENLKNAAIKSRIAYTFHFTSCLRVATGLAAKMPPAIPALLGLQQTRPPTRHAQVCWAEVPAELPHLQARGCHPLPTCLGPGALSTQLRSGLQLGVQPSTRSTHKLLNDERIPSEQSRMQVKAARRRLNAQVQKVWPMPRKHPSD